MYHVRFLHIEHTFFLFCDVIFFKLDFLIKGKAFVSQILYFDNLIVYQVRIIIIFY